MSSLEIEELTGKNHYDILRDIRVMLEALGVDSRKFAGIYRDSMNRQKPALPATIPTSTEATMSSLEIAELTGKKHPHVMRDICVMLEELWETLSKFGSCYRAGNGRDEPCYHLPYDETITLVTGYGW